MPLKLAIIKAYALSGKDVTSETIENTCAVWIEEMRDMNIDLEIAAQAYKEVNRSSKFMPQLSEVLELIGGDKDAKALNAWVEVLQAQKKNKAVYRPLAFGDSQIHSAIEAMGGWGHVYDNITHKLYLGEDLIWIKKEFVEAYKSSRRKPEYKYLVAHGDGSINGQTYEPILIGNVDQNKLLTTTKPNNHIARLAENKGVS